MLKRWTWLMLVLVALVALVGCSSDDDPITPPTPTQTAFEKVAEVGAAYVNGGDCPGVISATALHDNLGDYTVIDIRSEAVYLAGHVPGAYHSSLATILDDVGTTIPTDKPLVIACYSGQSAGHAKVALEMMGYNDTYTLGFGMASWNGEYSAAWDNATGDALTNPETTNNNGDLVEHDFPTLTGDVATIVETRARAMLAAGFKGKSYADIMDNLDNYFIVNYFSEADYLGTGSAGVPGHIPGAFQFSPAASLGADQMLKYLPTDMPIIVYCWTSQTSSQVAAYLNMLGYEAYSLKIGANALFHSSLTSHKWSGPMDYEVAAGFEPNAAFGTLAAAGAEYINSGDCPGYIYAPDLNDNLAEYTVIDIRSQADFDNGHIPGAYRVDATGLLDAVGTTIPTDKAFVIACYTGQTASYYKYLMELAGYENSYFLFMGMSTWSPNVTGTNWATTPMVANALTNPETTNNNGDLTWHDYPATTGSVAERVDAVGDAGFQPITFSAIQDNLEEYFILNYYGVADYEGTGTAGVPGHIPGAYQFTPKASLAAGQMLGNLPSDGTPIVVYCWTGQHGAQVTAYLNMLGYNAKSLVYGANNLFHDSLVPSFKKWDPSFVNDFALETTTN